MKKVKQSFAILLAFVMVFALVGVQIPVTVQAATKVTFSCTKKTVAVGGKYTLTVKGVKDKKATYAWSSSNKKVATVSKKGVVSGVAEGSATIKCKITLSDKSTKTLSCKVTVKEQKAATSVKISNAKLDENKVHTIVVGESYDFNRKLSPSKSNDKTYWYILDEEYAEVNSSGVVTAKKAGITTLVAKVGIDRVSAEESTNKVVDSVRLNIVSPKETSADKFTYIKKQDGTMRIIGCDRDLEEVIVPHMIEGKLVTEIGNSAFFLCSKLKSVILPEGITRIGDFAFYYQRNLTNIEIPDGVQSIGEMAFAGCTNLTNIEIPESVTSIGKRAFEGTEWLASKQQENTFVIINDILIAVNKDEIIGSVTIPESVINITGETFEFCGDLTNIELPKGLTSIGDLAFSYCRSLTNIEIPESVTSIGNNVFDKCNNVTITVTQGSYAEQWAVKNGYEDKLIRKSINTSANDIEWMKAYLNYLNGKELAELREQYAYSMSCYLVYLDEDNVPELLLTGVDFYTDYLLYYKNAKVQKENTFFGFINRYVPYSGWMETSAMDSTRCFYNAIERWNGQGDIQTMASGYYTEVDGWGVEEFVYNWDDKNYQNREEYKAAIDAYWVEQGFELSELREVSYYTGIYLGNFEETIRFFEARIH